MTNWYRAVIAILLVLAGSACADQASEPLWFSTADGLVELQFPAGWFESEEDNPYDLQCFSKDEDLMTGIFLFRMQDLASDMTPYAILRLQVDDLRSKRDNFGVLEAQTATREEDTKLTTTVYSGEKGLSTYYYRMTLIEFTENPDIVLVALQSAIPSRWESDKPVLEAITRSARTRREE